MIKIPPKQFLIADAGCIETLGEVVSHKIFDVGARTLYAGKRLGVHEIWDEADAFCGYLLGRPIDLQRGQIVDGPVVFSGEIGSDAGKGPVDNSALIAWLERFAGPFHVVLFSGDAAWVLSSAGNSLVYDQTNGRVGSTAASLFCEDTYNERFDQSLYESATIFKGGWLPAGLTCHRGVMRLLPNHALELGSLEARRFWHGASRSRMGPEKLCDRIAEIAERTIAIAAQDRQLVMALTAGRDSRVALALARRFRKDLTTVTVSHDHADLDAIVAQEISKRLGLKHLQLSPQMADDATQKRWMYRNGKVVGGINRALHPTLHCFDDSHAILSGNFGEVGRAVMWGMADAMDKPVSPMALAHLHDLPANKRILGALGHWLNGLPEPGDDDGNGVTRFNRAHVLDLAFVENRLGGWASPQYFADPQQCYHAGPLENFEIFDCLMSLPLRWRAESLWVDHLVETRWSALADWPYNRYRSNVQNLISIARKMADYDRVRRQFRRRFAGRR